MLITSLNAKSDIDAYMELIENLGYKAKATFFQKLFKNNDETAWKDRQDNKEAC